MASKAYFFIIVILWSPISMKIVFAPKIINSPFSSVMAESGSYFSERPGLKKDKTTVLYRLIS